MTTTPASCDGPWMVTSTPSPGTTDDKLDASPLGEFLVRSAVGLRDRIAMQALVEEESLLSRDQVRKALVTQQDGVMTCRWEGMSGRLYTLELDEGERAFLGLVLSIVGVQQSYLAAVEYLDERRLEIVLRAMIRLAADNDRIAIGTRM
ncbi:hypothetical protein [Streptomyces sp. NRRL F-525]|uniref:hypothetical protein n=1 Tax=Streptomyces sp. NRRL F-525 TaxID=1463861 RepID=UPI00131DF8D7|nr:hypothetical protein [Streptomyces sp. NRRL F-525]